MAHGIDGISRPLLVVPALLLGFGGNGALMVSTVAGHPAGAVAVGDLWRREARERTPMLDQKQMAVLLIG